MVQATRGRSPENEKKRYCSQTDVERSVWRGLHVENHPCISRIHHGSILPEEILRDSSGRSLNFAPQKDVQFSNISSFLEHTAPSVSVHHLSKSYWNSMGGPARSWKAGTEETLPFFDLDELWDSFGEWSVYGAGVSLVCPGQDFSCQYYYTPTLSALQLYEDAPRGRRCESDDGSDAECSESSESDHDRHYQFHESETSSEGSHCEIAWGDEEGDEWRRSCRSTGKRLIFEYFENSSPYNRVPLSDQIAELQDSHPVMKGLRSVDLHPCSWFAVAWYPVYRIPNGPTSNDASASFLTYHSLSALPIEAGKALSFHKQVQLSQAGCTGREALDSRSKSKLSLPAFGLASYKCQGSFWNTTNSVEHKKVLSLQAGADEWLREQNISHPDFQFFSTRGGGSIGH